MKLKKLKKHVFLQKLFSWATTLIHLIQTRCFRDIFDQIINLEEALCDVYDAGPRDDNLALLYGANKEINMAVNTPAGLSERQVIKNVVLQGDTFGSILASVQVDSIGKDVEQSGYGYKYI